SESISFRREMLSRFLVEQRCECLTDVLLFTPAFTESTLRDAHQPRTRAPSCRCEAHDIIKEVSVGTACVCESVWVRGMKAKAPELWAPRCVCVPSQRLWSWAALPPTLGYGWRRVGGRSGRREWEEGVSQPVAEPPEKRALREETQRALE
ncbi:Ubiquitin carboxyl-terminal hydrolase 34, partial [Dissostichus eleginoides]